MTLATTFFSVLQVIGRADIPIKLVLTASAIKLILNVFLITIPQINISGAAISAVAANAVAAFGGYLALENVTGDDFSVFKAMFSPLLSGIVCAIAATLTMMYVRLSENSLIRLCCAVFVGGVFYIILLILTGGISIKNLLNRQKIKK